MPIGQTRSARLVQTLALTSVAALALLAVASAQQVPAAPGTAASSHGTVTFTKDVAPIFYRSCVVCHRPGSIAPMSLMTYEAARPWARSIKQKVATREMPPWYIERNVGIQKFKDDRSLTDAEVATITRWIDGGAPRGNPADMPAAPKFAAANEWTMGTPDVVISMSDPLTVAAVGPDWWKDVEIDPGFTEDRYVRAVESKPSLAGSEKVVHHAVANLEYPDGVERLLNEFAVGKNADIYPEGSGLLVKAGSKVKVNLHLHSMGEEIQAGVNIGLKFYPKGVTPKHVIEALHAGDSYDTIDVPAGETGRVDGYQLLTKPTKVISFQPHMHNRGSRQCVEAIFPNGKVETLSCARHNFAWMLNYTYADDVAPLLPAYTMLHVISWYDNTAANKYNPDPRNPAGFGNRSVDEMGFSWINSHSLTEEEFKQLVAERAAKRSTN